MNGRCYNVPPDILNLVFYMHGNIVAIPEDEEFKLYILNVYTSEEFCLDRPKWSESRILYDSLVNIKCDSS
jgi:hypothetical protein